MAAAKTKKRARTERREHERAADRLARDRERLARLELGGAAEHPIVVGSASQVEPHALGLPCTRCGSPTRVGDHAAVVANEVRLRKVRLACPRCGAARDLWFRLEAPLLN